MVAEEEADQDVGVQEILGHVYLETLVLRAAARS